MLWTSTWYRRSFCRRPANRRSPEGWLSSFAALSELVGVTSSVSEKTDPSASTFAEQASALKSVAVFSRAIVRLLFGVSTMTTDDSRVANGSKNACHVRADAAGGGFSLNRRLPDQHLCEKIVDVDEKAAFAVVGGTVIDRSRASPLSPLCGGIFPFRMIRLSRNYLGQSRSGSWQCYA